MKKLLLLLPFLFLFIPTSAQAAVAHSQNFTVCHTTAVQTQNCTLTSVTSGTNLIGECTVAWGNAPSGITVSTITWGGTTMPAAGTASTESSVGMEQFVLGNPPSGSNETVAVGLSATETDDFYIACLTFTGGNTTTPVLTGSFTKTSATSGLTAINLTITCNSTGMTTSAAVNANSATMANSGSGITFIGNFPAGSRIGGAWDYGAGASSVTDDYTWTGASGAAGSGFCIQAASTTSPHMPPAVL
jgi:hypothetical protein